MALTDTRFKEIVLPNNRKIRNFYIYEMNKILILALDYIYFAEFNETTYKWSITKEVFTGLDKFYCYINDRKIIFSYHDYPHFDMNYDIDNLLSDDVSYSSVSDIDYDYIYEILFSDDYIYLFYLNGVTFHIKRFDYNFENEKTWKQNITSLTVNNMKDSRIYIYNNEIYAYNRTASLFYKLTLDDDNLDYFEHTHSEQLTLTEEEKIDICGGYKYIEVNSTSNLSLLEAINDNFVLDQSIMVNDDRSVAYPYSFFQVGTDRIYLCTYQTIERYEKVEYEWTRTGVFKSKELNKMSMTVCPHFLYRVQCNSNKNKDLKYLMRDRMLFMEGLAGTSGAFSYYDRILYIPMITEDNEGNNVNMDGFDYWASYNDNFFTLTSEEVQEIYETENQLKLDEIKALVNTNATLLEKVITELKIIKGLVV